MGLLFFFLFAFATVIVWMICVEVERDKKRRRSLSLEADAKAKVGIIRTHFDQLSDFTISHRWYGHDLKRSIALDEHAGLICLLDSTEEEVRHGVYRAADLLDVAVVEDGTTVSETRTSRDSQLAGAIVGGVLFGGVGAIVGGLSGKQVSTATTIAMSIELRLTLNDTQRPLWRVLFLNAPTAKGSHAYRAARDQALQWQALLSVLIRRADQEAEVLPVAAQTLALPAPGDSFHVSRNGEDIGPMAVARIQTLLSSGHLSAEDYYFDPQLNEWLALSLLPT